MHKKGLLLVIFLIFLVSIISVSSVKDKDKKDKGPYIDPDIEKALQKNPEAFVIVTLKEPDDDILTKEEKGKFRIKDDNFTKLKRQKSQDKVISKLGKHEFKKHSRYDEAINGFSGKVKKSALKKLEKDPDVDYIELVKPVAKTQLSGSVPLIQADIVHNLQTSNPSIGSITGRGEKVCIIDSGIWSDHPDLIYGREKVQDPFNLPTGPYIQEACFCEGYGNDINCCHPRNLPDARVAQSSGPGTANDIDGHGTHVAGIVGANKNPNNQGSVSYGITGVAPEASIIAVKGSFRESDGSHFTNADLVSALNYCASKLPTVISMSLGGGAYTESECNIVAESPNGFKTVSDTIKNIVNVQKIPIVIATGNKGCKVWVGLTRADDNTPVSELMGCKRMISWPACLRETISVSSHNNDFGGSGAFANVDPIMTDIMAPGNSITFTGSRPESTRPVLMINLDGSIMREPEDNIYSTWPADIPHIRAPQDGIYYQVLKGTSMAAPHVSGAIALLQQYAKKTKGMKLTPNSIERVLKESSKSGIVVIFSDIFPSEIPERCNRIFPQIPTEKCERRNIRDIDNFGRNLIQLYYTVPALQIADSGKWATENVDQLEFIEEIGTLTRRRTITPPPPPPPSCKLDWTSCASNSECCSNACVNSVCFPMNQVTPGEFEISASIKDCTTASVSFVTRLAEGPNYGYHLYKNTDSSNTQWNYYASMMGIDKLDVTGLTPSSLNSFFVRAEYGPPLYTDAIKDSNKIYVQLPACDSKAPDLIIVEPKNRTYNSTEYLGLNFTVHDSTMVDKVWYRIDNRTNITIPGNQTLNIFALTLSPLDITQTGEPESLDYMNSTGAVLHLWAKDTYGNINYTNVSFARNIFEIRINSPNLTYYTKDIIKFNLTVNLATSQYSIVNVSLYINGNWSNGSYYFTINDTNSSGLYNTDYIFTKNLSNNQDGTYYWAYSVCDTSNYCRYLGFGTIVLDRTKPVVNLLTGNNSWTSYFFTYEVDDSTSVTCYLYGDFNGTYALNRSTNQNLTDDSVASNGIAVNKFSQFSIPGIKDNNTGYLWNVMCNDSLGNYAFNSTNFTAKVDTIVPLINFTTGTTTNKSLAQKSIFANVSASDLNLANISIRLDNSSGYFTSVNLNSSGSYNFTNLNDEIYDLYAIVTDLAGNTNYTEIRTIILDNAYPIVNLVSPANNTGYSEFNPVYTYNVSDVLIDNCTLAMNSTLNQTFNNTNVYTNQYIYISNLTKGKYYWNVSCTDTLNRINTSLTFLTKLGYLPPAIPTINEIYRNGKERIFELVIQNNATKFMENISWTFDTGDNVIINSTLLVTLNYSDLVAIYIPFTYSDYRNYTITAKASYNADPDDVLNVTYTTTSDVRTFNISNLKVLNQNYSNFIFEFNVINFNGNNQSSSNWSFNSEGVSINSNIPFILNRSESVMVFEQYNYTSYGSFTVTVSGIPEQYTKPASITIDNRKLELVLQSLSTNNLTNIIEFTIKNKFNVNISDVSWVYSPDNNMINSNSNSNLIANETVLVYVQYTYNNSGAYNINASTRSVLESAHDSMIKTITI